MMHSGQEVESERSEQPLAVLPYAASVMNVASVTEVTWRESPDGWVCLLIPAPPVWRRMIGPAIELGFLTLVVPVLMLMLIGIFGKLMLSTEGTAVFLVVFGCFFFVLAFIKLWLRVLLKIIRLARYGK